MGKNANRGLIGYLVLITVLFAFALHLVSCDNGQDKRVSPQPDTPAEPENPDDTDPDTPEDPDGPDDPDDVKPLYERCVHSLKFNQEDGKYLSEITIPNDLDIASGYLVMVNSADTEGSCPQKPAHSISVTSSSGSELLLGVSDYNQSNQMRSSTLSCLSNNETARSGRFNHRRSPSVPMDILKSLGDFDSGLSSKSAPQGISQKNDDKPEVGSVRTFKVYSESYDPNSGYSGEYVDVEAELKRLVTRNTSNGDRTLYLYLQQNLQNKGNIVSDDELDIIADCFFGEADDDGVYSKNGIYGTITNLFASDEGLITGNPDKTEDSWCLNNIIPNTDELVILFCDIDGQGPDVEEGYVTGFFDYANYLRNDALQRVGMTYKMTNEVPILFVHAYKSGGTDLRSSLITIAHEYQHLIHNQYFGDLAYAATGLNTRKDDTFTDEMLSLAVESLLAKWLSDFASAKTGRSIVVEDPFHILLSQNGLVSGFVSSDSENQDFFKEGKGPYLLDSFGTQAAVWHYVEGNNEQQIRETDRKQLIDYGRAAGFAHYILVNFGTDCFKSYFDFGRSGFIRGMIPALKRTAQTLDSSYSVADFLNQYACAALLSPSCEAQAPYLFNKKAFFDVGGLSVPSVDISQYYSHALGTKGIKDSDTASGERFEPITVNLYKVLQNGNLKKGDVIDISIDSAPSPSLDMKLVLIPAAAADSN